MKKIFITLTCVLIVFSMLLFACQRAPHAEQPETAIRILAVESFLADIAQNVASDRLTVNTLVPIGLDPHSFTPSPQDLAHIASSNLLILNGAGFEDWAAETLENAGGRFTVVEASTGLIMRGTSESEEVELSPQDIADQLCTRLAELTPQEEIISGSEAANAAELHNEDAGEGEEAEKHGHEKKLVSLKLNALGNSYSGYVLFGVEEDAEYVIAANGGVLAVHSRDGVEMDVEETLPLSCAGLKGGILLNLEPGEYVIALSGLATESTPFFAGHAVGHHHEGDPHFWLDPLNVVKYAENIRDALIALDPEGAEAYRQNARAYISQLQDLDAWIIEQVSVIPEERRLIVTDHDTFGYFADRYGFTIIGTVIPSLSTGASPSAQQLSLLVDSIRENGAAVIFIEAGSNPILAEQVARETGVKVIDNLYTHSLSTADGEASSYLEMMRYNVQTIVEALK